MKNSLYDKDERLSRDGCELSSELHLNLSPIIEKWIERGYKIREIESVAHGVVLDTSLGSLLLKQSTFNKGA